MFCHIPVILGQSSYSTNSVVFLCKIKAILLLTSSYIIGKFEKKSETYAGVLRKDIKSKLNGHFVWESFQTISKILTNCLWFVIFVLMRY